jgi:hypothetical protein
MGGKKVSVFGILVSQIWEMVLIKKAFVDFKTVLCNYPMKITFNLYKNS